MSVASELTKLETNRSNIVAAINEKGGTLDAKAGLSLCPDAIKAITAGTDTSDATATAEDITEGKTAYIKDGKVTGTLTKVSYYTGSTLPSSTEGNVGDIFILV